MCQTPADAPLRSRVAGFPGRLQRLFIRNHGLVEHLILLLHAAEALPGRDPFPGRAMGLEPVCRRSQPFLVRVRNKPKLGHVCLRRPQRPDSSPAARLPARPGRTRENETDTKQQREETSHTQKVLFTKIVI